MVCGYDDADETHKDKQMNRKNRSVEMHRLIDKKIDRSVDGQAD